MESHIFHLIGNGLSILKPIQKCFASTCNPANLFLLFAHCSLLSATIADFLSLFTNYSVHFYNKNNSVQKSQDNRKKFEPTISYLNLRRPHFGLKGILGLKHLS